MAKTPACGFSIGFERIITILLDKGFKVPGSSENQVFLLEKGISGEKMCAAIKEAMELRSKGVKVLVAQMNKNKKFQKEQLMKAGFTEFKDFYKD